MVVVMGAIPPGTISPYYVFFYHDGDIWKRYQEIWVDILNDSQNELNCR